MQVKWQVKMKLQVKVKVKVKYKQVKLSGSPRERVGAHHELSNEKSITGGCAPNEYVRLAEWESCNCTVREFGLCVNLHSGDLVAQWKGVNRLHITQLRGFEGFARAAAGAFKGS